jgi:histidine triad (HIT) family protein
MNKVRSENCIFCKIIEKEIPAEIIYEDDQFISIVDIQPNNLGHSLLIPKDHFENIYTMQGGALEDLGKEIQKLSLAVKKAFSADGINVHMNNDPAAGQIIFHAHIHIIPRFHGDGLKHFALKEGFTQEDIKNAGQKIREAL